MAEGINMGRKSPWTKEEYVKFKLCKGFVSATPA